MKNDIPFFSTFILLGLVVVMTGMAIINSRLKIDAASNNPDPRILVQHSSDGWTTVQEGTNLWIVYIQRLVPPTNNFSPVYNIPSK